jgi:Nuclear speckle splicing regulatory protein 1, N-terminal
MPPRRFGIRKPTPGGRSFGLNIRAKGITAKALRPTLSVFGVEDDDISNGGDEESCGTNTDTAAVNRQVFLEQQSRLRQKKLEQARAEALAQDASVFEYDAVYDSMQDTKKGKSQRAAEEKAANGKQSRYIGSLLEQAQVRQREREIIHNRTKLRDRMKEGNMHSLSNVIEMFRVFCMHLFSLSVLTRSSCSCSLSWCWWHACPFVFIQLSRSYVPRQGKVCDCCIQGETSKG